MPFLIAAIVAIALTPLAARLAVAVGLIDRPGGTALKIHARPIPVLGGLAVVAGIVAALYATGARSGGWVLAAILLSLTVGLVDDRIPLPPSARLAAQTASGILAAVGGIELTQLGPLSSVGTVLVVVVCSNAVNLIDGQDGLASGLSGISALGIAAVAGVTSGGTVAPFALAVAGACAGFLVWNRPPARIFLGNGGAYGLGTSLGIAAAMLASRGWSGTLAAGACLGVFAFEIFFTVARRLIAGAGLSSGDRNHSYDLLANRLGSRVASTVSFLALGAGAITLAVVMSIAPAWMGAAALVLGGAAALLLGAYLWPREAPTTGT